MAEPIKVLIVDDEEEFAQALAERLELRDLEVRVAVNGAEARKSLDQQVPHVVLLDLLLPGENGLDLLAEIKKKHPCLPVLLLTGRGGVREDLGESARQAHCCLSKPVDLPHLLETITAAISAARTD